MSNFRNYINSYEFETELPGSGETIIFKPVTTGQIKKLLLYETSNDSASIEIALDDMINECVVKPEKFNVRDLYIQDRFFLLVEIRKATRGASYSFQTVCASCDSQTQQVINLSDLVVTKLDKTKKSVMESKITKPHESAIKKGKLVEKIKEVPVEKKNIDENIDWNVVKLNDNISVKLLLVTRNMQQRAFNLYEETHKNMEINELEKTLNITTTLYALSIKSIITPEGEDAELPLEEKIFFLDNIQQTEQEKIASWFDANDFGIDFTFPVKCSHCGFTEKKEVPVENFFY